MLIECLNLLFKYVQYLLVYINVLLTLANLPLLV